MGIYFARRLRSRVTRGAVSIATCALLASMSVQLTPPVAAAPPAGPLPPVLTPQIDPSAALALNGSSSSTIGGSSYSGGALASKAAPTEVASKRTTYSNTYDNHDGTYTAQISTGPINYLPAGSTTFEPIDATLAAVTGKNGRVRASKMATPVEIGAPDDSAGFVSMDTGAGVISLHLAPGVSAGKSGSRPVTKGSQADVSGVMSNIDLRASVDNVGVHTYFILNSRPSSPSFTLALDAGGLTPSLQSDGSILFLDSKGATVACMPAPYATDSAIDPNRDSGNTTYNATYALVKKGSQYLLTVSVDSTWLAGATYPVYVDPSVTGSALVWNNTVSAANYLQNYRDHLNTPNHEFLVGYDGGSQWASYLKFDLQNAGIPAAYITADTLTLLPYWQWYASSETTYVSKVTTSWDPATLYWNNAPFHSSPYPATITSFSTTRNAAGTFSLPLSTVQGWASTPTANYGIYLYGAQGSTSGWKRFIDSQDTTGAQKPLLNVTYTLPSTTVTSPAGNSWTASNTVSWNYTNPSLLAQTKSSIQVATDSGFTNVVYGPGAISNAAWSDTIPSLTNGAGYFWRVQTFDGYGWSAWSTGQFRWDASAPSAISVTDNCSVIGGCYRAGNTIYYQPAAAKTITLTSTGTDAQSGIASSTFGALTAPTGWTYSSGTVAGNPSSKAITWSSSAVQTNLTVTATNWAGGTASQTISFIPISSGPTADFATPNEGTTALQVAQTPVSIAWAEPTTPGIASRSLQRQIGSIVEPGNCAGVTFTNDGAPITTASPVSFSSPAAGNCYRWQLTLTDTVGNVTTSTSGLVLRDLSSAFGQQSQMSLEGWDLGAGDQASVNVATGNLVVSHSIVSLPIRGSSVAIGLSYNSQDSSNVGLGTGWRLNLTRRLTLNADGTVTFVDADGARYLFTNPVTNGTVTTYTRPTALFATLVRDTSQANQFTLAYKGLSLDRFLIVGSDAVLARQQDRFGNGVTVAYNSGTEDMSTVTDDVGRVIDFAWNTASTPHQLTSITDWAWIDGSGVVQMTATGTRRTYRFFYDGAGALIGWSDPLNTGGSCPTGGSHLTCLTYTSGQLAGVAKTQTYTTFNGTSLGSATRVDSTAFAYANGDLASITDALNNQTTFDRATSGQTVVHRPATGAVTYSFSANDPYARIASISRSLSGTPIVQNTVWDTTFPTQAHSVTENATAALSAPSRTVTYSYFAGSMGNMAREVEPLTATTNRQTDYTYNANNDVTQTIVSQDGSTSLQNTTRYCYDSGCSLTGTGLSMLAEVDNFVAARSSNNDTNVKTEYQYDTYGQKGWTTRHNRDSAGTDLDDRIDRTTYDNYGNLTASIVNYGDGSVTGGADVTPDSTGARTDLTTSYGFDTAGNQVSVADPRRAIELVGGSAGADDYVTRSTYDALNEAVSSTTPTTPGVSVAQKTSSNAYDELGAVRTATDANGIVTGTAFDAAGRSAATFEIDPAPLGASQTSAATYDAAGRTVTSKNAGQVISSALGYTLSAYDDLGQLRSVTDAAGSSPDKASQTTTSFDGLGRKTADTYAVGATNYTNDLGGRVLSTDDGLSCSTKAYDYRDRAATTSSGLDSGSCTDSGTGSTTTNTYDGLGRLTLAQITAGANSGDKTTNDLYDSAGNKLSDSTTKTGVVAAATSQFNILGGAYSALATDGSTTKSNFDPADNVSDTCLWASGATVGSCYPVGTTPWANPPTKATSSVYDAGDHAIGSIDAATGMTTTYDPDHNYAVAATYLPTGSGREYQTYYGYDSRQRVTSLTHQDCLLSSGHSCTSATVVGSDAYTYDANDNRTRVTEYNGAATSDRYYCYDAKNQLVAEKSGSSCSSSPDETYTFDDSGNRLSSTVGGITTNFAYDTDGRLCAVGANNCSAPNITYDDAGRTKAYNGWFYLYDSAGRLISACQSTNCTGTGFNRVDYTYDGDGNRTKIAETTAGGVVTTTVFTYQSGAIVGETVNDTPSRGYLAAGSSMAEVTIPEGTAAGTYVVTWNGHGDATSLNKLNSDGSLTPANSFSYSTWGAPTTATTSATPDLGFRFLYAGSGDVQWDDSFGLGLEYMHARSYAPALGRFIQAEPAQGAGSPFVYAANSPSSKADPDGTCWMFLAAAELGPVDWALGGACVAALVSVAALAAVTTSTRPKSVTWPALHWENLCFWCSKANRPSIKLNADIGRAAELLALLEVLKNFRGMNVRLQVVFGLPPRANAGLFRRLDICTYPSAATPKENANFCIEVKAGNSAYTQSQRNADAYLTRTYHFPIWLWRFFY